MHIWQCSDASNLIKNFDFYCFWCFKNCLPFLMFHSKAVFLFTASVLVDYQLALELIFSENKNPNLNISLLD